jgi:hypothetical protein
MASTDTFSDNLANLYVYYNVSHPVGDNAQNYWTDIMLVQYFIRTIYQLNSNGGRCWTISPTSRNDIKDLPDPHRDFKALQKTAKWIKYFQIDGTLHNLDCGMTANGRVEPINRWYSRTTGMHQPVWMLNMIYRNSLSQFGVDDWRKYAMNDASMPATLKSQLKERLNENVLIR